VCVCVCVYTRGADYLRLCLHHSLYKPKIVACKRKREVEGDVAPFELSLARAVRLVPI
jgi:hypothetical protein